ncbi:MAG: murein biosynthesis integral membrane protein MurJ [Acidobacteriota bacterium]|nr:murein biosynthesis integral membrane protein MurJ [Acidobacteriota bacterium]
MQKQSLTDAVGPPAGRRLGGASRVAAGILSSRILGLVRDQLIAYFFGLGRHADVLRTVFRGPNILQNLMGEQTLSASFIPIYSRLLSQGRDEEAGRLAGAVFGLLVAAGAGIALLGILFARPLVALLSPGFLGDAALVAAGSADIDRYELAVTAVRIVFPMVSILVLSAWALGVLNSHRRFFSSYFAPVLWNVSIIAALLLAVATLVPGGINGATDQIDSEIGNRLLLAMCWGALLGGVLQFGFQLPLVAKVLRGFRLSLSTRVEGVRTTLRNMAPLVAARGAAQLSSYLDLVLASFLVAGAPAALVQAQTLYLLPIALFALSVSAAELPELSSLGDDDRALRASARAARALRRIAFWVVPTAIGYLSFGYLIVGALFRRGRFGAGENALVFLVLGGYTLGLLATSWSRLLLNVFYSVGETKIPARISIARVALSALSGVALMLWLDRFPVFLATEHLDPAGVAGGSIPDSLRLGAVGLAVGAGLSSWVELSLLLVALRKLAIQVRLPALFAARAVAAAAVAALAAVGVWWLLPALPREITAAVVVPVYAVCYFCLNLVAGVPEAREAIDTLRRGSATL